MWHSRIDAVDVVAATMHSESLHDHCCEFPSTTQYKKEVCRHLQEQRVGIISPNRAAVAGGDRHVRSQHDGATEILCSSAICRTGDKLIWP